MKAFKTLLLAVGLVAGTVGCGGKDTTIASSVPAASPYDYVPFTSTTDSGTGTVSAGQAAPMTVTLATLRSFFFQENVQSPTNPTVTFSVTDDGTGHYGGTVTISYVDGGTTHTATMSTTHPWSGISDNTPNVWFNYTDPSTGVSKQVWHGFFQDMYGAIVIVVDSNTSLGDGNPGLLAGRVYYQNFGQSLPQPPQGPNKMCWDIEIGPFDCRTFLIGSTGIGLNDHGVVATGTALYPNNHTDDRPAYTMLGTFTNLSTLTAFPTN
jgi:hypothetical protein